MAKLPAKKERARASQKPKKDRQTETLRSIRSREKWSDHPAGFHIDGEKIATLKEVLAPDVPTMSLTELQREQRVRLVLASLRAKSDAFVIGMIGPGLINKVRAIAEVEAQSRIGRTLMEIELTLLSSLTNSEKPVS